MKAVGSRRERKEIFAVRALAKKPDYELREMLMHLATAEGFARKRGFTRVGRVEAARLLLSQLYAPGPKRDRQLERMIKNYIEN